MKPLLSAWTQKKRNLTFLPFVAGIFLVVGLIVALSTQSPFVTILLAPPAAVAGAWALVGWPHVTRKDGSPLVPERHRKHRSLLFFPTAPLLAAVIYPILGTMLTGLGFPVKFVAILSLVVAILAGIGLAYLAWGFPDLVGGARRLAQRFPADRRPFLFFPAFVLIFLVLYFLFGVMSTRLLGRAGSTGTLLNVQVLVLLPLTLLLAGGLAYLLFGFPKPKHTPAELIEKVPGRRRPVAFAMTFLLLGVPFTIAMGALVSGIGALPDAVLLPLGVLLGFSASLGLAALLWGTPQKWRRFADYKPGLPKHTRVPLLVGGVLATIAVVTVVFGLVGADIFWGLLTGTAAGILLGLKLSGATQKIAARKGEATLVPELPDGVKPLILFPSWFLTTALLFTVLTYVLPDLIVLNFLLSLAVGLLLALGLVEQSLWQEMLEDQRREKEKRLAFEARRRAALERRMAAAEASDEADAPV